MFYSILFVGFCFIEDPIPKVEMAPAPRPVAVKRRVFSFYGEVVAVDARSVTIRGNELNDNSPKLTINFPASRELRRGEQSLREPSTTNYRLIDLKVGDKIDSMIYEADNVQVCEKVCIWRRPGGQVPPAPFEPDDVPHKYHMDANSYQAQEERGVPLPLRLNLDYQRELSKAQEEARRLMLLQRERIAPPPRPLIRK